MRLRTLRRHPLGRTVRHLDIQNCVQCVVVVRHLHGQPCQVEVVLYIVLVDLREACANVSLTTHIAAFRELCSVSSKAAVGQNGPPCAKQGNAGASGCAVETLIACGCVHDATGAGGNHLAEELVALE